jgi:hypothetical protein
MVTSRAKPSQMGEFEFTESVVAKAITDISVLVTNSSFLAVSPPPSTSTTDTEVRDTATRTTAIHVDTSSTAGNEEKTCLTPHRTSR